MDSDKVKFKSKRDFGVTSPVQCTKIKIAIISFLDKVNLTMQSRSPMNGMGTKSSLFLHKSCSEMLNEASRQCPMILSITLCCSFRFIPVYLVVLWFPSCVGINAASLHRVICRFFILKQRFNFSTAFKYFYHRNEQWNRNFLLFSQ